MTSAEIHRLKAELNEAIRLAAQLTRIMLYGKTDEIARFLGHERSEAKPDYIDAVRAEIARRLEVKP